jgi:transposase
MPKKAGDRVNTDRRDAMPLARLARAGDLTGVSVPKVAADAMGDRSRARDDTLSDRKDAQFRLNACWLRHDIRSTGRANWSPAHLRGLSAGVGPTPTQHIVLQADVRAVTAHTARLRRLQHARQAPGPSWRLHAGVAARQAVRGVPCTVAVTMGAAMGDRSRFDPPRELRQCLGWRPAEYSAGERRQQGAMTKAGKTPARRALGDGAWAYRYPAQGRRHLPLRLAQHPPILQDIRWQAPGRRGHRDRRLVARGKPAPGVTGAMARELAGCMGAIAPEIPLIP